MWLSWAHASASGGTEKAAGLHWSQSASEILSSERRCPSESSVHIPGTAVCQGYKRKKVQLWPFTAPHGGRKTPFPCCPLSGAGRQQSGSEKYLRSSNIPIQVWRSDQKLAWPKGKRSSEWSIKQCNLFPFWFRFFAGLGSIIICLLVFFHFQYILELSFFNLNPQPIHHPPDPHGISIVSF